MRLSQPADFGYTYDKNSNITYISFDHRPSTPDNDFTYDDLNRLIDVEYLDDVYDLESFTMDDLGNRTSAVLRGESSKTYARNEVTNRYDEIGTYDISCSYDNAGNTIVDQDGYQYWYDYENRIIRIEDSGDTAVAAFEYDALGRRIYKYDAKAEEGRYYYYNANWQVLSEYDETSELSRYHYIYGNYIDEVLERFIARTMGPASRYYVHDHLYSTVALTYDTGAVVERYEYNAYGKVQIMTPAFVDRDFSLYFNPYTFTGRRLDTLDSGDYEIMYYRNRYYDTYTGRFLQQDPMEYVDGMNLYEYVRGMPVIALDPMGLKCSPKLLSGGNFAITYNAGNLVIWTFFMTGSVTPSDGGLKATAWVHTAHYYLFWFRRGEVEVDIDIEIVCHEREDGCSATFSTTGISQDQRSIAAAAIAITGDLSPEADTVTLAVAVSGAKGASGGPSITIGVPGTPAKIGISWPNAGLSRTYEAGSSTWQCQCD